MEKQQQDFIIQTLLDAMCKIQDELEPKGLSSNEIQWCNDLYDEIQINYFNDDPDSDYQNELVEQGEKWDFDGAFETIECRIRNMSQSM